MKKLIQILTIALVSASLFACESLKLGDAGLSRAPETSGANIDTLFASIKDADKVLASAYYYLPYGLVTDFDDLLGDDALEALTDHYSSARYHEGNGPNELYYSGALTASAPGSKNQAYCFGKEKDYHVVRYAWLFLQNADRIPDPDPVLLAQKKAEAKVCMAIAYAHMLRFLGGVPIIDHAVVPDEQMRYPRNTFAETVNFIVKLCDEAAPDLPWAPASQNEYGRMTRAAALGLKLRILCFAASPTFNSDTPWHPQANEYTCYMNYDHARWQAAKDAADEFMAQRMANGHYELEKAKPDANGEITPAAYRQAYRRGYFSRESDECIISIRKSNDVDFHADVVENPHSYGSGCTLEYVNKFAWADGTPFEADFDWANPPKDPFFRSDPSGLIKIPGIETRDPRLYETVAVPGDIWRNGQVGNVYANHRNFQANMSGLGQMKYILQTGA